MLSVIFIWLYICITTFIVGYGVLRVITRHLLCARGKPGFCPADRDNADPDSCVFVHGDAYLVCGLVCVTVYAQFFSLFAGVGLWANLILCAVCVLTVLVDRKMFVGTVRRLFRIGKQGGNGGGATGAGLSGRLGCCAVAVLFLLFAYGTSRGIIHYDTGLYHAQSIRWTEEYGVVKGLGNLHCRLAYNSSSFALSALYSMAFLGGQSYHCAAGWLAFLLAAVCLEIGNSLRMGRLRAGGFARVMCVYYLVNIFDEMISPASDYFMVLLAFYIVIRWLDLQEREEHEVWPYALLCVLGVFLLTVKLSAALILLLTVYPAYFLLREKRWREIGLYLGLGILTALPFFIRNVMISGWLVYPFTRIDLFDVAWKIPKGLADYDAREIQVWGRGYTDVTQFALPLGDWLPGWFGALAGSDKVLVLAAAVSLPALLLYAAGMAFGWWRRRPALLLAQAAVAASFLFWLCTSPLVRYGCVYVYLMPAVVFGGIYGEIFPAGESGGRVGSPVPAKGLPRAYVFHGPWRRAAGRVIPLAVVLLLAYKGFALCREMRASYVNNYWIVQKDYESYETYAYEIDGVTFYCPVTGDQVGYESFPSSPAQAQIVLLGEGVRDGFRAAR